MFRKGKISTQKLPLCSEQTAQNSAVEKWKFCAQKWKFWAQKMELLPNTVESLLFRDFPHHMGQFRSAALKSKFRDRRILTVERACLICVNLLTSTAVKPVFKTT